jgi:hypothetical protein
MHRMNSWVRAVAALLVCGVPVVLGGHARAEDEAQAQAKRLLMHYMPWYTTPEGRGSWGGHWTGWQKQHNPEELNKQGLPDIWSHYHPLIGTYDSADPDVIECHLLQMKLAGIDGVIVDWYGIGQSADYPQNHEATEAVFEGAGRFGMEFSVCYEDRTLEYMVRREEITEDGVGDHLRETMEWMDTHWFGDERYSRVDGRPLLLNFGPIYLKDGAVWDAALGSVSPRPAFYALHHLWRGVNADGGFTWVHSGVWNEETEHDAILERLARVYSRVADDPGRVIVSALPGFKDVYENSHPYVAHRGGETLRQSLQVCLDGPWDIVQLVTWNDYGEGTIIEPTHEFGYLFLEIIQEARREEAGGMFPFTAEDLRLPERLYRLRKADGADDRALDRVSAWLSDGDTRRARAEIDRLGG